MQRIILLVLGVIVVARAATLRADSPQSGPLLQPADSAVTGPAQSTQPRRVNQRAVVTPRRQAANFEPAAAQNPQQIRIQQPQAPQGQRQLRGDILRNFNDSGTHPGDTSRDWRTIHRDEQLLQKETQSPRRPLRDSLRDRMKANRDRQGQDQQPSKPRDPEQVNRLRQMMQRAGSTMQRPQRDLRAYSGPDAMAPRVEGVQTPGRASGFNPAPASN